MTITDCRTGDIINVAKYDYDDLTGLNRIEHETVDSFVVETQKMVFGSMSNFQHVHTELYIGDGLVFSVEPPKPLIRPLNRTGHERYDVYRWKYFEDYMIPDMARAVNQIVSYDKPYDVGQLLDTLLCTVMGYPFESIVRPFDFGKHCTVCSAGVATVFNKIRKVHGVPRMFTVLNRDEWSKDFIAKYEKDGGYWRIERTFPACFSNTLKFDGEIQCVGWMI